MILNRLLKSWNYFSLRKRLEHTVCFLYQRPLHICIIIICLFYTHTHTHHLLSLHQAFKHLKLYEDLWEASVQSPLFHPSPKVGFGKLFRTCLPVWCYLSAQSWKLFQDKAKEQRVITAPTELSQEK